MTEREKQAVRNFADGCNCAQSVLMAYADVLGLTQEQAAMVSVGFGGGMGRLRLHCGAFSAAVMLAGAYFLGFQGQQMCALMVLFAAPVAVSSYPMAVALDADGELAGQLVAFSTLFSLVTIFGWTALLSALSVL